MLRPLLVVSALSFTAALALTAGLLAQAPAAPSASGEAKKFSVDNGHSTVLFRINHVGASYVHGRFNELGGTFSLSDAKENPVAVDMQVKAATIDTNLPKRDDHLRSADFFNAKEFPTINFKSKSSKKLGPKKFQVTGDLTLLGVTKSVTTELEVLGPVNHAKMGTRAGFETVFAIKRSEYGMKFMVGPDLGDEVRVTVSTEGAS